MDAGKKFYEIMVVVTDTAKAGVKILIATIFVAYLPSSSLFPAVPGRFLQMLYLGRPGVLGRLGFPLLPAGS